MAIHALYCKPGPNPMTGEVLGLRWEVTTDVLLNKQGVKLSSTYLYNTNLHRG